MINILLIGDSCIDEYQYGVVERISPEAPVPIFKKVIQESKPGMASNVMKNLQALGCNVYSILGGNSIKTRLIDLNSNQHIVRIDNDTRVPPLKMHEVFVPDSSVDAIVISDYDKGFVSYEIVEEIVKRYNKIPIFIDTKKTDLQRFEGCFVKINKEENRKATSRCSEIIVTLGGSGARYKDEVFPANKTEVVDVCGAGDTFLSALVYGYLTKNKSISNAIPFANLASSVTVKHMGVYAPTLDEINE